MPDIPIAQVDQRYKGFGVLMDKHLAYHREIARKKGVKEGKE